MDDDVAPAMRGLLDDVQAHPAAADHRDRHLDGRRPCSTPRRRLVITAQPISASSVS